MLAKLIYEKSKELPEDIALEVLYFIEFLKMRVAIKEVVGANYEVNDLMQKQAMVLAKEVEANYEVSDLMQKRAMALATLNSFCIDFMGKPMSDREAANARE
jgi:cell fate (sporulation/competence/biofilm development) regulator YlbF (YheA/YmcA/DUF963 family)